MSNVCFDTSFFILFAIIMNPNVYRWCVVPQCNNTTIKTPNKLFINVPIKKNIRKMWLNLARRDPATISTKSVIHFCQDHFDLPDDMENYYQYHIMGSVSQVRMKSGCIPKRFECQPDRIKRTSCSIKRPYALKKQRKMLIAESEKALAEKTATKNLAHPSTSSEISVLHRTQENQETPTPSVQQSDSDKSYTPSVTQQETSALQMQSIADCSEVIEDKKKEASNILKYTILKIMKSPCYYIGLHKSGCYLLDIIVEKTGIPINHLLLCLKKIKLNSPFKELADDFSMATVYASKIFFKNIPKIASFMRPFIVKLNKYLTKLTLTIIDCLEIEVQKPFKGEAFSLSDDKNTATIKYLVSCTRNGLVNYVSPGYGDRMTDTCLVECCDFIKCLQPGTCVMTDRGFKHIEQHLRKEVLPPSIVTGAKLSKIEEKESKQIASLRIHIERVTSCLREFKMLNPHAFLNTHYIEVLDDIIVIACAFVNLQDSNNK